MKAKLSVGLVSLLLPVMAFAQRFDQGGYFASVVGVIGRIINTLIPIFIALIVVYFIWGLIKYVQGGDDEKMKEARSTMIHGVIAIFVAVAIWGLVGLLRNITGANQTSIPVPTVPGLQTY